MRDLFICPACGGTTEFEGAPGNAVWIRHIHCKCGRSWAILVNYGCRVLNYWDLDELKTSFRSGPTTIPKRHRTKG